MDGVVFVRDGLFFFFKQKTAYEMRISDWSSDVCSSDLAAGRAPSRRLDAGGDRYRGHVFWYRSEPVVAGHGVARRPAGAIIIRRRHPGTVCRRGAGRYRRHLAWTARWRRSPIPLTDTDRKAVG